MTSAKPALIIAAALAFLCQREILAAPASLKAPAAKTAAKAKGKPDIALSAQGKSAFFGPFSMQIGNGLRIRAKFGFTVWSSDKPNDVYMLNAENKTYIRETAFEWLDWNRRGCPNIDVSEVQLVDKANVHGQPCLHYAAYQMIRNRKVKCAEFYSMEKGPRDPVLIDFWCKHFLLPSKYGFPLLVKQRVGEAMQTIMDIEVKPMPLANVSLSVPKDYKRTTDKAAFYFSDGSGSINKSDLEEFFQQPLK
jgi:hypothetical protein